MRRLGRVVRMGRKEGWSWSTIWWNLRFEAGMVIGGFTSATRAR